MGTVICPATIASAIRGSASGWASAPTPRGATGRGGAGGDGGDALGCDAESQRHFDRLGAEQVYGGGDAFGSHARTRSARPGP